MLQHYLTTKHAAGSDWRKHHEPDALPLSPPSRVEGCADTHWQARTRLSLPHLPAVEPPGGCAHAHALFSSLF
jgi:hypothetical protein